MVHPACIVVLLLDLSSLWHRLSVGVLELRCPDQLCVYDYGSTHACNMHICMDLLGKK